MMTLDPKKLRFGRCPRCDRALRHRYGHLYCEYCLWQPNNRKALGRPAAADEKREARIVSYTAAVAAGLPISYQRRGRPPQ